MSLVISSIYANLDAINEIADVTAITSNDSILISSKPIKI